MREIERGSKAKLFLVSLAIHVILLVLFPFLLADFRKTEEPEPIEISFYRSEERPHPPAPSADPIPEAPAASPDPEVVERKSPPPGPAPRPEVVPQVVRHEPSPEPELSPAPPPAPQPKPEAPRPVRTNLFPRSAAETVETKPAPRQPRNAGFGEPAPQAIPDKPRADTRASARPGAFEVAPARSETQPSGEEPRRGVTAAGFGDEPEVAAPPALRTRDRQTVRSAGFSIEAITGEAPASSGRSGSVSTGGFGDTVAVNDLTRERRPPVADPDTPVEILAKPKPVYTPEARALQVEGEIVLRVVFVASGEMRVLGVVQGLGHGLDESAVEAAKKIEFKPARRNGQPVDYVAVLRIVFQLA